MPERKQAFPTLGLFDSIREAVNLPAQRCSPAKSLTVHGCQKSLLGYMPFEVSLKTTTPCSQRLFEEGALHRRQDGPWLKTGHPRLVVEETKAPPPGHRYGTLSGITNQKTVNFQYFAAPLSTTAGNCVVS